VNSRRPAEDPLIHELRFYAENKRAWLSAHPNEFVVIAGNLAEGFHPDYETAFKAGLKAFGVRQQFLIKQICEFEPVYPVY